MLEPPADGRVYRMQRRIRLADTSATGRLRLDAAARYVQDIATDDVADAGMDDGDHVWIVRRAVVNVVSPFRDDTTVTVATWSGGLGARWATRRTSSDGDAGAHIETETLWAFVHAETLKLTRLPAAYHTVYGDAIRDATVSGKLLLPQHPPEDAGRVQWSLRVTDIDILGHVNNAVYWEAVESELAAPDGFRGSAVVEHRQPIDLQNEVVLRVQARAGGFLMWFVADGAVAAVTQVNRVEPPG
jgi:acyl-ACP thioesterase